MSEPASASAPAASSRARDPEPAPHSRLRSLDLAYVCLSLTFVVAAVAAMWIRRRTQAHANRPGIRVQVRGTQGGEDDAGEAPAQTPVLHDVHVIGSGDAHWRAGPGSAAPRWCAIQPLALQTHMDSRSSTKRRSRSGSGRSDRAVHGHDAAPLQGARASLSATGTSASPENFAMFPKAGRRGDAAATGIYRCMPVRVVVLIAMPLPPGPDCQCQRDSACANSSLNPHLHASDPLPDVVDTNLALGVVDTVTLRLVSPRPHLDPHALA
ncbi:hypothetical protein GGX14DRAFT_567463 [Mycena pura]|uniref:Uncharacterized protein n=1 Tax=Mycena pura TaxID=153505 RepID=A0AAD6VAG0_9AGAR|nr:hypothetical protein GGX14DRAFT_567463 [Mycena pura]